MNTLLKFNTEGCSRVFQHLDLPCKYVNSFQSQHPVIEIAAMVVTLFMGIYRNCSVTVAKVYIVTHCLNVSCICYCLACTGSER